MYLGQNGQVVTAYSRYYVDNTCNDGALVSMDNVLRQGFTGEVILWWGDWKCLRGIL